jgi:hypothetical protein
MNFPPSKFLLCTWVLLWPEEPFRRRKRTKHVVHNLTIVIALSVCDVTILHIFPMAEPASAFSMAEPASVNGTAQG